MLDGQTWYCPICGVTFRLGEIVTHCFIIISVHFNFALQGYITVYEINQEILVSVSNDFRTEKKDCVRRPDPILSYLRTDPEARGNRITS